MKQSTPTPPIWLLACYRLVVRCISVNPLWSMQFIPHEICEQINQHQRRPQFQPFSFIVSAPAMGITASPERQRAGGAHAGNQHAVVGCRRGRHSTSTGGVCCIKRSWKNDDTVDVGHGSAHGDRRHGRRWTRRRPWRTSA
jgi:hypothetical protein